MKKTRFIVICCLALLISLVCVALVGAQTLLVDDSHLTIEEGTGYVLGIPVKCTGAQLKPNFNFTVSNLADDSAVGTGLTINGGGTPLTVVVLGDVNGDGKLTSTDYVQIKKHFTKDITLKGASLRAADVTGDGAILSTDYLKIKRTFSGADNIYADMLITPGFNVTVQVDGTGGTAKLSGDKLVVTPDSGYRLSSLKADGHDVYISDGELSLHEVFGKNLVAKFAKIDTTVTASKVTPSTITNTFYNSEASQYGITWRTEGVGEPVLLYVKADGKTAEKADFTKAVEVTAYADLLMDLYKNHAAVFGLEPGTKYYYKVGDKTTGTYSDVYSITAREENPSKVTFFHMSDTQDEINRGTYWNEALKSAYALYPDAAFTLNTGDIVNNGADEQQWIDMMANTVEYTASNVVVPVSGNHEYWPSIIGTKTDCINSHYDVDVPNGQSTATGIYYSFDYGNIHFTILNTGDTNNGNVLGSEQLDWLKKDLAASKQKWKVVALHNPLYSPGKYGLDTKYNAVALALREQLNPILAQYKVDLVLNGHDHVYSQSYPIDGEGTILKQSEKTTVGDTTYYIKPQGTIHLESATAGAQNRGSLTTGRAFCARMDASMSGNSYYSAITVEGNQLTVQFYQVVVSTGTTKLLYSFGIMK